MAKMSEEQFKREIGYNEGKLYCTYEYAIKIWRDHVEPYLDLITHYRNKDKFLNEDMIRLVLKVPEKLWSVFKKMPTLRMYLDLERDLMNMKAKKDLVRGVELAPDNAKMLELQLKRFDSFYHEDGKPQGEDIVVKFTIEDQSLTDKEISSKTGIREDEVK